MGRKDELYFARQERRAKHDPAAGGDRAAQSATHNTIAELEAKVERLENSHRERLEASTRWLWALQEIVDGDYEHIDEVVAIAQKAMEGK